MTTKKADLIVGNNDIPNGVFNGSLKSTGIEFVLNLYGRISNGKIKQYIPPDIIGVLSNQKFAVERKIDQMQNIERSDILFNKSITDIKYIPKIQKKYNIDEKYLLYRYDQNIGPLIVEPEYRIIYDISINRSKANIKFNCVDTKSQRRLPDLKSEVKKYKFKRENDKITVKNSFLSRIISRDKKKDFYVRDPYNEYNRFDLIDVYTDFRSPYTENYDAIINIGEDKIVIKVLTDVPTYFKYRLKNNKRINMLCNKLDVDNIYSLEEDDNYTVEIQRIHKDTEWSSESGNYKLIKIK